MAILKGTEDFKKKKNEERSLRPLPMVSVFLMRPTAHSFKIAKPVPPFVSGLLKYCVGSLCSHPPTVMPGTVCYTAKADVS